MVTRCMADLGNFMRQGHTHQGSAHQGFHTKFSAFTGHTKRQFPRTCNKQEFRTAKTLVLSTQWMDDDCEQQGLSAATVYNTNW